MNILPNDLGRQYSLHAAEYETKALEVLRSGWYILGREEVFSLDKPNTGIYIPRMVWKDMYDFSPDSVLLVLASEHYDGSEYLRDYEGFKAALAAQNEEE